MGWVLLWRGRYSCVILMDDVFETMSAELFVSCVLVDSEPVVLCISGSALHT